MTDNDDCEYCSSSKRLRRNSKTNIEGNNNNNYVKCDETTKHYECMPIDMQVLFDMPKLSMKQQLEKSWNPLDASINIDVKTADPMTLHRHPVAQSTDGIRGKLGYEHGIHLWKIDWKAGERGTHAVVGLCGRDAVLHCHGYCSLIGADVNGWGWDIVRGRLVHDGRDVGIYGEEECVNGEEIYVMLDMDVGTLSFAVSGRYLGVAFTELAGSTLYPAVSAVWGHCEITMTHIGSIETRPVSLLHMCRFSIRRQLRSQLCRLHHGYSINNNNNNNNNNNTTPSTTTTITTRNHKNPRNCLCILPNSIRTTINKSCSCNFNYTTPCHTCLHYHTTFLTSSVNGTNSSHPDSQIKQQLAQRITSLDVPEYLKQYLKNGES